MTVTMMIFNLLTINYYTGYRYSFLLDLVYIYIVFFIQIEIIYYIYGVFTMNNNY